jgi:integrase/recombinase XerD
VPIIDRFRDALAAHRPKICDRDSWLFPSPIKDGQSITWSAADKWLRLAVTAAGMEHRGISGHSLRRSFITRLHEAGIDLHSIQQITGHKSVAVLQKYIGSNPRKIRDALRGAFS